MNQNESDDIEFRSPSLNYGEINAAQESSSFIEPYNGQGSSDWSSKAAPTAETPARYYFFPTWRSQLLRLIAYFVLCFLTVYASWYYPKLVIASPLFPIGRTMLYLYCPILILIPGFLLIRILLTMYNSKYIIDERGVEAQIGIVSSQLRQPRLRWEDIRGVEPIQTITERLMNIGTVVVGSAMNDSVEIVMTGVENPKAIQILINTERDRFMRDLKNGGIHVKHAVTSG